MCPIKPGAWPNKPLDPSTPWFALWLWEGERSCHPDLAQPDDVNSQPTTNAFTSKFCSECLESLGISPYFWDSGASQFLTIKIFI